MRGSGTSQQRSLDDTAARMTAAEIFEGWRDKSLGVRLRQRRVFLFPD
jgi:hypothetical protein